MGVPVLAAAEYVLRHGVDTATELALMHRPVEEVEVVLRIALREAELLQADLDTLGPIIANLPDEEADA